MPDVYVVEGDTVRFEFTHFPLDAMEVAMDQPFKRNVIGKVLEVKRRYGCVNGGTTPERPLLKYINQATGETTYADVSYVTEVIEHPKGYRRRKTNIFAKPFNRRAPHQPRKGLVEGSITGLVAYYLGGMSRELTRPLSEEKVIMLFRKQNPGLVKRIHYPYYVQVHVKPFKRWVERNVSRLLMTVDELRAAETAANMAFEAEWEADRMHDLDGLYGDMEDEVLPDEGR